MRNMNNRKEQKAVIFRLDEETKEEFFERLYSKNITSQQFLERIVYDYIKNDRKEEEDNEN